MKSLMHISNQCSFRKITNGAWEELYYTDRIGNCSSNSSTMPRKRLLSRCLAAVGGYTGPEKFL
jgi:hypothetical protein